MRARTWLVAAVAAISLISGPGVAAQSPESGILLREGPLEMAERYSPSEIVVSSMQPLERCDLEGAVTTLRRFFEAVSDRRIDDALALMPLDEGRDRAWFSLTGPDGGHQSAFTTVELRDFLERRMEVDEQLGLVAAQANHEDGARLNFGPIFLARSASDLAAPYQMAGKGVVDCERGVVSVLSLGYRLPGAAPDA